MVGILAALAVGGVAVVLAVVLGGGSTGKSQPPAPRRTCNPNAGTLTGRIVRLTYEGRGDVARDIPVMCERLRGLGIAHQIRRAGTDRVVVSLPEVGGLAEAIDQVGTVAQLAFYDWEINVIGPDGKTDPSNPAVTGGPSAGSVGAIPLYDAILRAAKQPVRISPGNGRESSAFYAVDPKTKKVFRSGKDANALAAEDTKADALANVPKALRDTAKVYEVKQGTVIVRAEQPDTAKTKTDQWFVLRDDVALKGTDIKNPEQNTDNGAGGSGGPVVTFDFTSKGRKIWQNVTRRIAERGSESVGLLPGQDASSANQHFAIVLDDELVSTPFIDFRQNPDGIDGRTGSQISGGFTIKSAQALANVLKTGALPVAVELIASSEVP